MDAWELSPEVFLCEMLIEGYEEFLKVGVSFFQKSIFWLFLPNCAQNFSIYCNLHKDWIGEFHDTFAEDHFKFTNR